MNNQTRQTNTDYKQIMNSKSVQEMIQSIRGQKINVNKTSILEEIKQYKWGKNK